jgi:hypothetical protein
MALDEHLGEPVGGRDKSGGRWFGLWFVVIGSLVALGGVVGTVESFRQDVAVAEVVALEDVDNGSRPRARVRFTAPDGRVVTPLVTKHDPRLQPGYRVEIRYDPDDPEAAVEYDRLNGLGGLFVVLVAVTVVVVGLSAIRKDTAARRRDE